jgi:hypothetical protein
MHYPPETSTIMLVCRIFAMILQSSNQPEILSILNDFQDITTNEDLMIFHKMLGENFSSQLSKLHFELQKTFENEEPVAKVCEEFFKSMYNIFLLFIYCSSAVSNRRWIQENFCFNWNECSRCRHKV